MGRPGSNGGLAALGHDRVYFQLSRDFEFEGQEVETGLSLV